MASLLSIVVLSKGALNGSHEREGCLVQPYISTIADASALHAARLDAIAQVQTRSFIFVDDTDAFLGDPIDALSIVYGAEIVENSATGERATVNPAPWSLAAHLCNPHLIHRGICNTASAKAVAEILPRGAYYTEWMLYLLMASWRGAVMSYEEQYLWAKAEAGFHTQMSEPIRNTALWLLANHKATVQELSSRFAR